MEAQRDGLAQLPPFVLLLDGGAGGDHRPGLRATPPDPADNQRTTSFAGEGLGAKLFARVGRNLQLTDTGRIVYGYAEEIFSLGRELQDTLKSCPLGRPLRLLVGVADTLPKEIVYRLLEPALRLPEPVQLICDHG